MRLWLWLCACHMYFFGFVLFAVHSPLLFCFIVNGYNRNKESHYCQKKHVFNPVFPSPRMCKVFVLASSVQMEKNYRRHPIDYNCFSFLFFILSSVSIETFVMEYRTKTESMHVLRCGTEQNQANPNYTYIQIHWAERLLRDKLTTFFLPILLRFPRFAYIYAWWNEIINEKDSLLLFSGYYCYCLPKAFSQSRVHFFFHFSPTSPLLAATVLVRIGNRYRYHPHTHAHSMYTN